MNIYIGKPYITEVDENTVRLNSDITSDDVDNKLYNHTLFYETEKKYENDLCVDRIDAFVLGLLSSAMNQKANIVSEGVMSERIVYQLENYYIPLVANKFKDMNEIVLDVKMSDVPYKNKGGVVTGNSGGVDSFYTIMKYKDYKESSQRLTHLIYDTVCSEDYVEERIRADFNNNVEDKRRIAKELGLEYIPMFTNLYSFYPFPSYVFNYFFTTSYTSCIYALQGLFSTFYFSSGIRIEDFSIDEKVIADGAYFDLLTVDCISSENLKVYSAGCEIGRYGKTEFISQYQIVQKNLQVDSIESKEEGEKMNCGICSKCLRTLSTLYALGILDKFRDIFDTRYFDTNPSKAIARMMAGEHSKDIANEIYENLKRNKLIKIRYYIYFPIFKIIFSIKSKLSHNKFLKKMYYKSGIAGKIHEKNGGKTVYDEFFEKYGEVNVK